MKIEWLLRDLDQSVGTYTDLRKQLQNLQAHSPNYTEIERELREQITQLAVDVQATLIAIDEGSDH